MLKIDAFTHIMPPKYRAALYKQLGRNLYGVDEMTTLYDLEARFRLMDKYPGYLQVPNVVGQLDSTMAPPAKTAELARIANDELAELVDKYPERFAAGVAILPLNDMDAALKETDRAIKELRLRGILLWTSADGKPLDSPEFLPLYEKMSQYNLPILFHPGRSSSVPDYTSENKSKYAIHAVWGWPYETTVAMTRLVFGGVLEKYPNLKFVTHHAGAMVPYFAGRIAGYWDFTETRLKQNFKQGLTRAPVEYFRQFYGDTALYGNTPGLMCAHAFFGTEHLLFGTDMPFDSQYGERYIRDTIAAIEEMDIPEPDRKKIFEDNARRLFRLPV